MTNMGDPWPERGVAYPRICSQPSWRALAGCFPALRPAPSMPTRKDHERDVGAKARPDVIGREEGSRRGHGRRLPPKGRGSERRPPQPRTSRALRVKLNRSTGFDPLLPFKVGPVNGRKAGESGLRLKA
jgi:hypothetical protein